MIKKKLFSVLTICFCLSISYSAVAGTADTADTGNEEREADKTILKGTTVTSEYERAEKMIYAGKKLEKKGKLNKAKIKYVKAYEYLIKANREYPAQPDILDYLGFTSWKLEKYEDAEIYYLLGLDIEPNHIKINKHLGEQYVVTKRINKARKRLEVLKYCNCKEYNNLSQLINGTKKSTY